MSIYDFLYLLTDDSELVAIYDMAAGEEVFCGSARDAMEYGGGSYEVMSFDLDRMDKRGVLLVLNIDTEEEDV